VSRTWHSLLVAPRREVERKRVVERMRARRLAYCPWFRAAHHNLDKSGCSKDWPLHSASTRARWDRAAKNRNSAQVGDAVLQSHSRRWQEHSRAAPFFRMYRAQALHSRQTHAPHRVVELVRGLHQLAQRDDCRSPDRTSATPDSPCHSGCTSRVGPIDSFAMITSNRARCESYQPDYQRDSASRSSKVNSRANMCANPNPR
jgi:hypothetical protein